MRTSYLTGEMCQEQRQKLEGRTAEEHLVAAQHLLAGRHERSGPCTPAEYHWVPPTAEEAACAQAHATLALAMLAAESAAKSATELTPGRWSR